MSELRQDRISGEWVVIAPRRGERPREVGGTPAKTSPAKNRPCPFCHGAEEEIPRIVAEYRSSEPPGWYARVVVNNFPAFVADATEARQEVGRCSEPGFGYQEVVIETPRHDAEFITLSDEEVVTLMRVYRDRFSVLINREGIDTVTLFRNHGPISGASLLHPHSQLVATALHPPKLKALEQRGREHFELGGTCIICDEVNAEVALGERIVEQSDQFVTFVPFAPRYAMEMWIVPLRHQARFDEIEDTELEPLGFALRSALRRLRHVAGDISYNLVLDSAGAQGRNLPHFHWRIRIAPRFVSWGGFELGTEVPMNPVRPEDAASALRSADPGS